MNLHKARRRAWYAANLCMAVGVLEATAGFFLLLASAVVELISPEKYLAIGERMTFLSMALMCKGFVMSFVAVLLIPYLEPRYDPAPRTAQLGAANPKVPLGPDRPHRHTPGAQRD